MSLDWAVWRNDRTDGRASGAQKIGCRSNAFWGSAAKRQPPFVPEIVGGAIQPRGNGEGSIVFLVIAIAAKPLPGNVRGFRLFEIGVISFGVEKSRICDGVLLIIRSQRRLVWRHIDNFGIERRHYRKLLRPRSFDRANAGCILAIFSLAAQPVHRFLNCKD